MCVCVCVCVFISRLRGGGGTENVALNSGSHLFEWGTWGVGGGGGEQGAVLMLTELST